MASIEEIVDYIADQNEISFKEIRNHFDESDFSLSEKLRDAEVQGILMRKTRDDGKEIWIA